MLETKVLFLQRKCKTKVNRKGQSEKRTQHKLGTYRVKTFILVHFLKRYSVLYVSHVCPQKHRLFLVMEITSFLARTRLLILTLSKPGIIGSACTGLLFKFVCKCYCKY